MSELGDEVLIKHEAFFAYDDFFHDQAKPECHGCLTLTLYTSKFALDVVRKLAKADLSGQRITRIDYANESSVLSEAQQEFVAATANCPGPTLEERDTDDLAKRVESFPFFSEQFRQKALRDMLPLVETCGLLPSPSEE